MVEKKRRDGSKTETFKFRMTIEEAEKLRTTSERLGISMSDVLREGISSEYLKAKYRN